jgi:hypothetical protein
MNVSTNLASMLWLNVDQFFRAHPAVAIMLASGGIFYGGYQYLARGRKTGAFLWMSCAAVMSFGFSIGALACRMWTAGLTASALLGGQVWLMKHWFGGKAGSG